MSISRRTFAQMGLATAFLPGCSKAAPNGVIERKPYQLSAEERRMVENIPYKRIEVKGQEALVEWQRLQGLGKGWPIVIGGDEELSRIAEQLQLDDARKPEDVLKSASTLQHPGSLRKYRADALASLNAHLKKAGEKQIEADEEYRAEIGDWPAAPPGSTGLEVAFDVLSRKPYDRVHILILPTANGYEAPAYLNWGNWNECPAPEIHVAALRRWHEDYGAQPIGMSGDVINLRVSKRPASRAAALELAKEQYSYCADIVDQGVETLSNLAAGLMSSDWWYFWWD